MMDPITLFRDGGPFMYLVVLVWMAHLLLLVIQLPLVRMADLRPLLRAGLLGLLVVGLLGTFTGLTQAFMAVAHASSEMKGSLMAMGTAVASYTTLAALTLMVPNTILLGVVETVYDTVARRFAKPDAPAPATDD